MAKGPILFSLTEYATEPWVRTLLAADPSLDVRCYPDWGVVDGPAYAFTWNAPHGAIASYPNIEVIFSLGAGVDHLLDDPSLPSETPIVRMGDASLKNGMADYVVMNTLWHHRGMPTTLANQRKAIWQKQFPALASDKTVGIMGYGTLGKAAAARLKPFGYALNTWSNSAKPAEDGITHYHGKDQLKAFLGACDIVVCLLPATEETYHLINAETLAMCREGAAIINSGRGAVLDLDALIEAIKNGPIAGASLDVFEQEPLPSDHPAWAMDEILITPHISAVTHMKTAVEYVLAAIETYEAGGPLPNLLNKNKGY